MRTENGEGMYMNRWDDTGERGHCWSLSMGQRSTGREEKGGREKRGEKGRYNTILDPARAPQLGPASKEELKGRDEPPGRKGRGGKRDEGHCAQLPLRH